MELYREHRGKVTHAPPGDLLREGTAHQLAGRLQEAAECFAQAIDEVGTALGQDADKAEGYRLLGINHHLRGETATGIELCTRGRDVAVAAGLMGPAAMATVALANMACEKGAMNDAREHYRNALMLAPGNLELTGRIELNLGILESVQGNLDAALEHYGRAIEAYEEVHDALGRAKALHNIGMIRADKRDWAGAERSYEQAAQLARQGGDYHLGGLCLLNRAEVDVALERYEAARKRSEEALAIFDRLDTRADVAAAFRMLGIALRHLKRPMLAESRLLSALEIARATGVPLSQAESCRDLAVLYAETGRRHEAIGFMDEAHALFEQIGAARDAVDVKARRALLSAA